MELLFFLEKQKQPDSAMCTKCTCSGRVDWGPKGPPHSGGATAPRGFGEDLCPVGVFGSPRGSVSPGSPVSAHGNGVAEGGLRSVRGWPPSAPRTESIDLGAGDGLAGCYGCSVETP